MIEPERQAGTADGAGPASRWRFWPLALIAGAAAVVLAGGGHDWLSLETLRAHHLRLGGWVDAHRLVAVVLFVVLYAAAIVVVPPSATVLTIAAGVLFGWAAATALVVVAATIGATVLFLAARHALAAPLRARAGPALRRLEAGFRADAGSYLLVLRLVPLFPFWLVNVAPALLGVPLRTYVLATAFGIIPGTAVFAAFGAGLDGVLAAGGEISLAGVLSPEIVAALVGLAALSLLPVVWRRWRAARERAAGDGR